MGRKTWDSIPERNRPLKGRVNVVVSRTPERSSLGALGGVVGGDKGKGEVLVVGSIEEGLRVLQKIYPPSPPPPLTLGTEGGERKMEEGEEKKVTLGRVFVIGGAQIYEQALRMECCERILWTRVGWEGECDVFFPGGVLDGDGQGGVKREGGKGGGKGKWVRGSREEMERWIGEEGVGGLRREGEVEFEVCMLERVGEGGGDLRKGEEVVG